MAAPSNVINNLRNGSRVYRLVLGELPSKLERIKRMARRYRRDLEDAVSDRHGEVSILHAHEIDAAVSHEQHAAICRWLLNNKLETMAATDIMQCSKALANAKESRNRLVRQLGLDVIAGRDKLDALYTTPTGDTDERKPTDTANESSSQTVASAATLGGDFDAGGDGG